MHACYQVQQEPCTGGIYRHAGQCQSPIQSDVLLQRLCVPHPFYTPHAAPALPPVVPFPCRSALIGEMDDEADSAQDLSSIRAPALKPIVH